MDTINDMVILNRATSQ